MFNFPQVTVLINFWGKNFEFKFTGQPSCPEVQIWAVINLNHLAFSRYFYQIKKK